MTGRSNSGFCELGIYISEEREAPKYCLFILAIFSTEIPLGHSASQL